MEINQHTLPGKVDFEEIKLQVERCIHSSQSALNFNNTGTLLLDQKFKGDVKLCVTNFINRIKTLRNFKVNRSFHYPCKQLSND